MAILRIFKFIKKLRDHEFCELLLLVTIILLIGTFFYHHVEGWRWIDSFYFSSISLTTVGYGDFAPKTDIGKIFTIIYIFSGVGIIIGFLTAIAKHSKKRK